MVQEQAKQAGKERLLQLGHNYIQFACEEPHAWQMIFEHRLTGEREMEWFQLKVARMFALVETGLEPLAAQHSPGRSLWLPALCGAAYMAYASWRCQISWMLWVSSRCRT